MSERLAVVVDIGGTNTRVAIYQGNELREIRRFLNAENAGITSVLQAYMAELDVKPQAICIDLAGPIENGVGQLTNLHWVVDPAEIRAATGAQEVVVINDLQAMGYSVSHLDKGGLQPVIVPGPRGEDETRLVFNVGTGMNATPVYHHAGKTLCPPTEAGHVTLPIKTPELQRLKDWLATRLGEEPGLEDVLSGRGLSNIYNWLSQEAGEPTEATPPEIFAAFKAGDARATQAARLFVQIMGCYAGDLALISMPVGGVYLVGGVAGHFAPYLDQLGFAEAFRDKGRFSDFMDRFPVYAVTDDYAALKGCAACLAEQGPA